MSFTDRLLSPVFRGVNGMEFAVLEHVDYVLWDEVDVRSARKIAGNAQKISRDRFDHHTSWLWKYDIEQINKYLAVPPIKKQPDYRNNRNHEEFLLPLAELFNFDVLQFEQRLLDQLSVHFEIEEVELKDLEEITGDYTANPMGLNGKEVPLKTKIINHELEELHNNKL